MGTSSCAHALNHECATMSDLITCTQGGLNSRPVLYCIQYTTT